MSGLAEGIAGLALSAVSVAALFTSCIDAFNIIAASVNFGHDYELLCTALTIQKLRLYLWGESVGLASRQTQANLCHPGLDDPVVKPVLLRTLRSIKHLLVETRDLNARYDLKNPQSHEQQRSKGLDIFKSSFEDFEAAARRNQKQNRLRGFIDGLQDISKSLEVLSDQQARMKEEIESISDREGLQLIHDAAGQEDVANVARQQLQLPHAFPPVPPTEDLTSLRMSDRGDRNAYLATLNASLFPNEQPTVPSSTRSPSDSMSESTQDALVDDPWMWRITPSTPKNFSRLFPSNETLSLHLDGRNYDNMNLCVATSTCGGTGPYVQLFCLKMDDIKKREFSLLRYHRNSGRKVCSTSRIYRKHVRKRTRFRRSISSSLSSIHSLSSGRTRSTSSQKSSRCGSQSGADSEDFYSDSVPAYGSAVLNRSSSPEPTNQINMIFSNYTQVELSRKGAGKRKRYGFEYWGTRYQWKRTKKEGPSGTWLSYSLFQGFTQSSLAQIRVQPVAEKKEDAVNTIKESVPPARMRITDERMIRCTSGGRDVPDVVLATGLVAYVDDCLERTRYQQSVQKKLSSIRHRETACRQCRIRKIRCSGFRDLEHSRCTQCEHFDRECIFMTRSTGTQIKQKPEMTAREETDSKAEEEAEIRRVEEQLEDDGEEAAQDARLEMFRLRLEQKNRDVEEARIRMKERKRKFEERERVEEEAYFRRWKREEKQGSKGKGMVRRDSAD